MKGLVEPIDKVHCDMCGSNYPLEHFHSKCLHKRDAKLMKQTKQYLQKRFRKILETFIEGLDKGVDIPRTEEGTLQLDVAYLTMRFKNYREIRNKALEKLEKVSL